MVSTVKEYLESYETLTKRIDDIERELEAMRAEAEAIVPMSDGMPKEKIRSDKVGDLAARIADTVSQLNNLRCELIDRRKCIANLIFAISDSRYSQILYRKYILLEGWNKIADDLHYVPRHLYRLHGEALIEAESLLSQCSGNKG